MKVRRPNVDGSRVARCFAAVLAVTGCAENPSTVLSPEGARVRVSQASEVEGCEFVGDSLSHWGQLPMPPPWGSNQVLNGAAEHGATDVVMVVTSGGTIFGKGYRCSNVPVSGQPPPPAPVPPVPAP